jgi:hypothetical protein
MRSCSGCFGFDNEEMCSLEFEVQYVASEKVVSNRSIGKVYSLERVNIQLPIAATFRVRAFTIC